MFRSLMSDGDDSIAMSIEDAFAQTLADMEEAREELASIPVEPEPPSLDSAFEVAVSEVSEEVPVPNPPMDPSPILSPMEETPTPSMEVPATSPIGGPPMGGPPAGPPMGGPPSPPMSPPPSPPTVETSPMTEDHESTLQVADLSAITTDFQPAEEPSQELESSVEFDESVVVNESVEEEQIVPSVMPEEPEEPEFNPVDADDFMSDFQDDWDEKAPLRASDVD